MMSACKPEIVITYCTQCQWLLRAAWLAVYPVLAMAASTASRASGETQCPPLRKRDTVPCETPATRATSRIVGLRGVSAEVTRADSTAPSGMW